MTRILMMRCVIVFEDILWRGFSSLRVDSRGGGVNMLKYSFK